jgi:hypothetical protein
MTLRWVPGWNGLTEPEAVSYVAAVEAADGQDLEFGVARAINDFVVGCKNDGIWDAIKASCILAGARTLAGALVPLVGTAPTNYNFVSGDYNRETGLVGDGSTKYLDSNRNNNADPQNSNHNVLWVSSADDTGTGILYLDSGDFTAGDNGFGRSSTAANLFSRNRGAASAAVITGAGASTGFLGSNRSNAGNYEFRYGGSNVTVTASSSTPTSTNIRLFGRNSALYVTNARLAFYSIGESLDLEKLDTRVTRLIQQTAFSINTGLDGSIYDIDTLRYVNAGYAAGGTLT